jgi:hypothetical protein
MKTDEAPKKLYFGRRQRPDKEIYHVFTDPVDNDDIEYIRKDAFIDNVCEFLKSYRQEIYNGIGYIAGIVNDKTIEDFRNYMEE